MKILAIDYGSTNFKAYVINEQGTVLWRQKINRPKLNKVREVVTKLSNLDVDVITVTGHSFVPLCIDREGKVIMPYISFLDWRSSIAYDELKSVVSEPSYSGTKLASGLTWLKRSFGDEFNKVKFVMDTREYIGYLLTGRATYDTFELRDEELRFIADKLDLRMDIFGEPHGYSEPVGMVNGRGTPVYIMPSDTRSGLIGSGLLTLENAVSDIAGTTEILGVKVNEKMRLEPIRPVLFNVPIYFTSPPYGVLIEWAKRLFKGTNDGQDTDSFIVPRFKREKHRWDVRFDLINYSPYDRGESLLERVYMSIAAEVSLFSKLVEDAGKNVDYIIVSGGGSVNDRLNQLKANFSKKEVLVPKLRDTTIAGSLIIVLVNLGLYSDFGAASASIFSVDKKYSPAQSDEEEFLKEYLRLKNIT